MLSQNAAKSCTDLAFYSGTKILQINTFTAKGFSETSPVMHLNKHIFRSQ